MRGSKIKKLRKKEEGYVVGLAMSSGYFYHDRKSRHYSIEFCLHRTKDRGVIKRIKEIIQKDLKIKVHMKKDKRSKSIKLKVNSKELYLKIKEIWKTIEKKKRITKNFKVGFISGYLDGKGKIIGKRKIKVKGKKKAITVLRRFSRSLGIKHSKMKKEKKGWSIILSEFKGIRHSSTKIRKSYKWK